MYKILNYSERKDVIDKLQDFMIKDIDRAIKANANYLAALGLSTYTENMGGFLNGNFNSTCVNYLQFISQYFPNNNLYIALDTTLTSLTSRSFGGLYTVVRCGLVHEYFMKADSQVSNNIPSPTTCGIEYDPSKNPQLIFYLHTYFIHFKDAVDKYRNELLGITVTPNMSNLQNRFDMAYDSLKQSKSPSGMASVSGGHPSFTGGSVGSH